MSFTYSINVGQITESTSKQTINLALSGLSDNLQKQITPRDLRDAILTNWANNVFKIIKSGTFRYIGLDSGDLSGNDIKQKILIGKRRYNNIEILNQNLLSSDTDIFFYNTKEDNLNQDSTKVKILAGNSLMNLNNSPHLEAKKLPNNKVEFNIESVSNINIKSELQTVKINNIAFPTLLENTILENGKVLKYDGIYPNGKLVWSDIVVNNTDIGNNSDSVTQVIGDLLLNGFPLEFIEDNLVPKTIGGIEQGFSFSENSYINGTYSQNWPLIEVIRKLLYPYIEPKLELSVFNEDTNNNLVEIGKTASISISYSITSYARESSEYIRNYFITDGNSVVVPGASFSSNPGEILSNTQSITKSSITDVNYTLYVSNNWNPLLSLTYSNTFGFSYSITKKIEYIKPFLAYFKEIPFDLFGINAKNGIKHMIENSNRTIDKYTTEYPIEIGATGSGYLYLAYPTIYGYAKKIKDPNGFVLYDNDNVDLSTFTYSTQQNISPTSPYEYYGNYLIYRSKLPCSYDGLSKFKIEF
jgi:hypothetical protein